MNETTNPVDMTGMAVALGRIEEKVSRLDGFDDRLRKLETSVERMDAKQSPKTPWYVVLGGVASALTVTTLVVALIVYIASNGKVL